MTDQDTRTFGADFKRFFLRGLVILLPSVLTLWIVVMAYQFIDHRIAQPINRGVRLVIHQAAPHWSPLREAFDPSQEEIDSALAELAIARRVVDRERIRRDLRRDLEVAGRVEPEPTSAEINRVIALQVADQRGFNPDAIRTELRQRNIWEWWHNRWYMNLIGLVLAIVSVYIAGRLLGGFVGRSIYRRVEQLITSLPVFKQVYPYVKQIVDFLFSDDKPIQFNRVVAVEYPRKGIWSVGFQTGGPMRSVAERAGDSVTVFIPSSPTPFTGYTITVNKADLIELPVTVEEAIRFAVSGGVLVPDHQAGEGSFGRSKRDTPTGLVPLPGAAAEDARTVSRDNPAGPDDSETRSEASAEDGNGEQRQRDAS